MRYKKTALGNLRFYSLRFSKSIVLEWGLGSLNIHFLKSVITVKDSNKRGLSFSERYGYTSFKKIGKFIITTKRKSPDEIDEDTLH